MQTNMKTEQLPTEQINTNSLGLDTKSPLGIAQIINAEDFNAAKAVKKSRKGIAALMVLAAKTFQNKKRIIFIGAGTSGRLGILEAVECVPTFATKPSQIIGLIAGGKKAVFRSQEGAEDNYEQGAKEISKKAKKGDLVIGLTASGRTPYVLGALQQAKLLGANTGLVSCNPKAQVPHADIHVALDTGAEALSGSTRMKAGTATKMVLNTITTGAMVLSGKTFGNLMIDVQPTNQKLVERAVRLICKITGVTEKQAFQLLQDAHKNVKTAVVMHNKKVNYEQAKNLLKKQNGFLAKVIND